MLVAVMFVASVAGVGACQKADSAQRSAERGAAAPAVARAPISTSAPAVAAIAPAAKPSCGCGGGGASCGGACGGGGGGGGSCGGAEAMPQWAAITDSSAWTPLKVSGMHCGGCAKRIERALAKVDGVLAVKTDFQHARVDVATKPGLDARALVKPTIDGLGYRVE